MKKHLPLLIIIGLLVLISFGCKYIVVPEDLIAKRAVSTGWDAIITGVTKTENNSLHIEITLRNLTGEWSTMQVDPGKAVTLVSAGKSYACEEVNLGTGGHRLAPGFQMRGYTTGTLSNPQLQLNYVECEGANPEPGAQLLIDYEYFNGPLDYYHQDSNKFTGKFELSLDDIETDLVYPIFEVVEGLALPVDADITAISENVVNLMDIKRDASGFEFTWQNYNPTDFALKTHIGTPPVIGEDGIIYGVFQIMDLAPTPLTPAKEQIQWTTKVAVPETEQGFYILLSVESGQMRMYVNHLIDITQY